MIEDTETTIAVLMATLGILGTLGWYALAWYGIRTLQDVRVAIEGEKGNRH